MKWRPGLTATRRVEASGTRVVRSAVGLVFRSRFHVGFARSSSAKRSHTVEPTKVTYN